MGALGETVSLLKDAGPFGISIILLVWLYTLREDNKNKDVQISQCQKIIADLQEKRVAETQSSAKEVTKALINSTTVQEGNAEIFKAIVHRANP